MSIKKPHSIAVSLSHEVIVQPRAQGCIVRDVTQAAFQNTRGEAENRYRTLHKHRQASHLDHKCQKRLACRVLAVLQSDSLSEKQELPKSSAA
jgi:hypothetical protein